MRAPDVMFFNDEEGARVDGRFGQHLPKLCNADERQALHVLWPRIWKMLAIIGLGAALAAALWNGWHYG